MKTRRTRQAWALALICALALLAAIPALALDTGGAPFVPDPKTDYAAAFIEKSGGQQWFLDTVEAALNVSARSINTLKGKNDLDIIKTLAIDSPVDGSLPPAIGEFARLRYLFLGGGGLTGEIPDELYVCAELENLDLSGNALTGEISSDVSKLTKLKTLLLRDNNLTGEIPAFPASLTNLDLSNNALTGGIPESIGALTNLTVLGLSGNPLGGGIPFQITSLTKLKILLAHDCGFTGEIPAALGGLTNLQILDLSRNGLTGTVPPAFSGLTKLEQLALSKNRLAGVLPDVLASLKELAVLDLSNNALDGVMPETYNKLIKLKTLVLDGNKLSGEITDVWGAMTELELCYLRGNEFVGDVPASLVAAQTGGTDVRVDQNYLRGENTAQIAHNAGNFTDETTQEYQVKLALDAYTRTPLGAKFDVYAAFTVKRADNGNTVQKAKLPPSGYAVVIKTELDAPAEYFAITTDANGIYIELLKTVTYADAIEFELRMLPYDKDAPYTLTSFKAGTEAPPSGGTATGGAGTVTEEPEPTPTPTPAGYFSSRRKVPKRRQKGGFPTPLFEIPPQHVGPGLLCPLSIVC